MSKTKNAKLLKKPAPTLQAASVRTSLDTEVEAQFELELYWCVQQLESALCSGKLSQRIAEDTAKNIKTLKSKTAPLIKKRQVMKAALGDYRAKMKDEEKKMGLASKQVKFTRPADVNKKSSFVKKSAILTSGKDFRFNFPANIQSDTVPTDEKKNPLPSPTEAGETGLDVDICKKLHFNTNGSFMFNFAIDDPRDDITFSELTIKND